MGQTGTVAAEQLVHGYLEALELPVRLAADGRVDRRGDAVLLHSGTRVGRWNGVFTRSVDPAPGEVAALADEMAASGLPWSIQLRGEAKPEIRAVAERHGLTRHTRIPLLAVTPETVRYRHAEHPGLTLGTLYGHQAELFAQMVADAFRVGPGVFGRALSESLLDARDSRPCVAEFHGEPVSTGLTIRRGDVAAVFNVATLPAHRRRGFGRATMEWMLRESFAHGATVAALHPNRESAPLFASLGFTPVETWTYLSSAVY